MTGLVLSVDAWVIWLAAWCFVLAKSLDHVWSRRSENNEWRARWRDESEAHHQTRMEAIRRDNVVYTAVAWRGSPEEYTDELIEAVDTLTASELEDR